MAQAGWYPDPAGTPATYRYWDGTQWSSVTTADPSSPPPDGGMPPPPPTSGYGDVPGQEPYGAHPGSPSRSERTAAGSTGSTTGNNRGKYLVIGVAVVLALALAATAAVVGVRALGSIGAKVSESVPGSEATEGAGDQLVPPPEDSATPPPGTLSPGPPECRQGAPTVFGDQSGADRIDSHGVSIPRVEGYEVDPLQSFPFTWAFDLIPQVQRVEEGWASVYGVGGVETSFGSPEETAEAVVECMTASGLLYSGFADRKDLTSKKVDVPGAEAAWRITTEIRVDNSDISVEGDRVEVIVVDTGNTALYGLYTSVVPIDDKRRIKQQREITRQLRAE